MELERYVAAAPQHTRSDLDRYLADFAIDRDQVLTAIQRQSPIQGDPFFVSSIVRGLGSSTSDIDILLEYRGQAQATTMSTMLFVGNHRIGVKYIAADALAGAIADLLTLATTSEISGAIATWGDTHEVGWVDLERIINGWSYETGMAHLDALPALCAVASRYFSRDALYFARLATLAGLGGAHRAALAYNWGAMLATMDLVMAACGRVQVTRKWTLERWRRFLAEPVSEAGEYITAVNAARVALGNGTSVLALIEGVIAALDADSLRSRPAFRTVVASQEKRFFGTARAVYDGQRLVVADAAMLDLAQRTWPELATVDAATARSLVTLAQAGLVLPDPEPIT